MKPKIKVAFASGTDDLNARLIERMRQVFPELPLYVVSEFAPEDRDVHWIPYRTHQTFENWARCRAAVRGKRIRLAGVMLVPNVPFRRMRLMALALAPLYFLAVNENLNEFMLRPQSLPAIARHVSWRIRNFLRWHFGADGTFWRRDWPTDLAYLTARAAGLLRWRHRGETSMGPASLQPGLSVVYRPDTGAPHTFEELSRLVSGLPVASEAIAIGEGRYASAVNVAIAQARYSRLCVVDYLFNPDLAAGLMKAFDDVPDLFCAGAQPCHIQNLWPRAAAAQWPAPALSEGLAYALHGGGCCTVYDTAKLRELGGMGTEYESRPAPHVDLGYRAWRHGWPTVNVSMNAAPHICETDPPCNYQREMAGELPQTETLVVLAHAISDPKVFRGHWKQAMGRLRESDGGPSARAALRKAAGAVLGGGNMAGPRVPESLVLALTDGSVAVYPGRSPSGKPRVLIASAYVPFPLSHGGAVRMDNLTRRAAGSFDQILVAFAESGDPPARELLERFVEVVLVRRTGSHEVRSNGRPEVVEQFASASFRAALHQAVRKWQPALAQLEFTQMAQYAADCAPAHTILVEHDVTFDLYEQLLQLGEDWDLRRQMVKWRKFETEAWGGMDRVVTMSERDRERIAGAEATALPNGVDLDRFRPALQTPEPGRLLFVGSFSHLPNLLAAEFFLKQVWPLLHNARLHIIAGARHEYFLDYHRHRVQVPLEQPGVELEGFVTDVRPAYSRAAVVVAPLVASAGTNLKILEAMACARPVVSTPEGVNGLDLAAGEDFVLVHGAEEMARAIEHLLASPGERDRIAAAGRRRVERHYGWDEIAARQQELYQELMG